MKKLEKEAIKVASNDAINAKTREFRSCFEYSKTAFICFNVKFVLIPQSCWKLPIIIEKNCDKTRKLKNAQKIKRTHFVIFEDFIEVEKLVFAPIVASFKKCFFESLNCNMNKITEGTTKISPRTTLIPELSQPVSCVYISTARTLNLPATINGFPKSLKTETVMNKNEEKSPCFESGNVTVKNIFSFDAPIPKAACS